MITGSEFGKGLPNPVSLFFCIPKKTMARHRGRKPRRKTGKEAQKRNKKKKTEPESDSESLKSLLNQARTVTAQARVVKLRIRAYP